MAYDAAAGLKQRIQILQEDPKYEALIPNSKVKFILKELSLMLGPFLKVMRLLPSHATRDVLTESRIEDALKKVRKLIAPYMDRLELGLYNISTDDDESWITLQLSEVLLEVRQEIASFSEMLKINEEYKRSEHRSYTNFTSATSDFIGKKKMVGRHDQLIRLKYLVLEETYKSRLILVMGMTGIGKTALVQEMYKDPLVAEHYEAYLFLRFGPRYQFKEILLLALHQLGVCSDQFQENVSVEQLQDYVMQSLSGRRYLAVLDDVWNVDSPFWELHRNILEGGEESSCMIVTTQKLSLTLYFDDYVHLRLLDDGESWNLLRETVFTSEEERCSMQLERIGKKIAKKCEGLPLAIIQVGELLRDTDKTVLEWTKIAEKDDPLTISIDDATPLSDALSLTYTMLPQYLKVFFWYMGIFPKKYVIRRLKIVQLWVSEGFLQQRESGESLEEGAGKYLDELVAHCCVLRDESRSMNQRETKTCKMHFTFRSLCVSEAQRNKFFHIIRKYADCYSENMDSQQQRLCIQNNVVLGFAQVHESMELAPDVSSFLCFGPKQQYPIVLYLPFKSLKTLDVLAIRFYEFPCQILDLSELTYFAITCDGELPPSISRLQSLEVLIVHPHHNIVKLSFCYLPIEIWSMCNLKHLDCMGFDLPDPSSLHESLILGSLTTISSVSAQSCTREVLARMPRLMKLGIKIHTVEATFISLGDLITSLNDGFQSLKCIVMYPTSLMMHQVVVPSSYSTLNFPENIRKISLSGCGLSWEYMKVMAALPSLKVLKLRCYAFCGPEWIVGETGAEFPNLEYLYLEDLDLQYWVVNVNHFQSLEHLVIRHCYRLQEIPERFWREVAIIVVDNCSSSLVKQIEDWPFFSGIAQVRMNSEWKDKN